jgi:hypothetical protein
MSADLREEILAYLEMILGTVSGIRTVWRNRDQLGDDEIESLPAIILLDGREEAIEGEQIVRHHMVRMPPVIMRLLPEVLVQLYPRSGVQQLYVRETLSPAGPELSDWRMKVMAVVINDPGLVGTDRQHEGLLTSSGGVRYLGCETDYRLGAAMTGQMMLGFEFRYPLMPPRA